MSERLLELLGIAEPVTRPQSGSSVEVGSLKENFRAAISLVNEHLRSAALYAPSDRHKEIAVQRDNLFAAYQKVLKEIAADNSKRGEELGARLLAAVQALSDKTTAMAEDAAASFEKWTRREADYLDALSKIDLLEDSDHPKSTVLRQVVDAVQARSAQRDYTGAVNTLEQISPKLESIYNEFLLSQEASVQGLSSTGANTASPNNIRTVSGAGGYEYEQHADGSIFIVKSPKSGATRIRVQVGTTGYNAILTEIGPFPTHEQPGLPPSETLPQSPDSSLPPSNGVPSMPDDGNAPPPGDLPASLEELMAKDELTSDQIAEARRLIAQQPAELQGALYEQLQEKTEYCNQRNNSSMETSSGGTCNLTAVAMALSYLGVKNPYPEMDFDEALVKIATDEKYGDIKSSECWKKVAAKLGVHDFSVFASSVKKKRDWWESTVDNGYLKKGYGVVMSLDGHVVRLQAVTELGLVVDDPYGASKLSGRTFDDNGDGVADRPKYSFTESNDTASQDGEKAGNAGDDTGYPWADVEKYTFKYLVAFK